MIDVRNKINSLNNALINLDYKIVLLVMIIGISLYFGTIFFVFIPTEVILLNHGYSIFDFQMSWYHQNTNIILQNWSGVLNVAIYQTLMDYFFIIGGMLFLGSVYISLIKLTSIQRLRSFLLIGFWFVDIGALSDAVENVFSLLIFSDPKNYPNSFEFFLTFLATVKFFILPVEYGILIIAILLISVKKLQRQTG